MLPHPDLIAWYGTGSVDIRWTTAHLALFPDSIKVEIDQAFTGSPVPSAPVRDVENGAWTAHDAIHHTPWTAERRTIYCSRNTIPQLESEGWTGDVWLADPGFTGTVPPDLGAMTCVAVQNVFTNTYDSSIVFDDKWPFASKPQPVPGQLSVTILSRTGHAAWPRVIGADHYVVNYVDPVNMRETLMCRIGQVPEGAVVHANLNAVPGAHGGNIKVYAIVNGNPDVLGYRVLP